MEEVNREEAIKRWDILDTIHAVVAAWKDGVTDVTIANCFQHSRVKVFGPIENPRRRVSTTVDPETSDHAPVRQESLEPELPARQGHAPVRLESVEPELPPADDAMEADLNRIIRQMGYSNRMSIAFLLGQENECMTEALPTDDEILEATETAPYEEEGHDADVVETRRREINHKEALAAAKTLGEWAYQQEELETSSLSTIDRALRTVKRLAFKLRVESQEQSQVTDFFPRIQPSAVGSQSLPMEVD
ncbi:hypothetical protein CF327_g7410 [Tilletia walkeri]|nr:hypothetical protein CF327_g7410 [Tilletia walkeri]